MTKRAEDRRDSDPQSESSDEDDSPVGGPYHHHPPRRRNTRRMSVMDLQREGKSTKDAFIQLLNKKLKKRGVQISNLSSDWKDGKVLVEMLDMKIPGFKASLPPDLPPVDLIGKCLTTAECQLGVPVFVDPDDIAGGMLDDASMMTYLSGFFKSSPNLSRSRPSLTALNEESEFGNTKTTCTTNEEVSEDGEESSTSTISTPSDETSSGSDDGNSSSSSSYSSSDLDDQAPKSSIVGGKTSETFTIASSDSKDQVTEGSSKKSEISGLKSEKATSESGGSLGLKSEKTDDVTSERSGTKDLISPEKDAESFERNDEEEVSGNDSENEGSSVKESSPELESEKESSPEVESEKESSCSEKERSSPEKEISSSDGEEEGPLSEPISESDHESNGSHSSSTNSRASPRASKHRSASLPDRSGNSKSNSSKRSRSSSTSSENSKLSHDDSSSKRNKSSKNSSINEDGSSLGSGASKEQSSSSESRSSLSSIEVDSNVKSSNDTGKKSPQNVIPKSSTYQNTSKDASSSSSSSKDQTSSLSSNHMSSSLQTDSNKSSGFEGLLAEVTKRFSLPTSTKFTLAENGNMTSAIRASQERGDDSSSENISANTGSSHSKEKKTPDDGMKVNQAKVPQNYVVLQFEDEADNSTNNSQSLQSENEKGESSSSSSSSSPKSSSPNSSLRSGSLGVLPSDATTTTNHHPNTYLDSLKTAPVMSTPEALALLDYGARYYRDDTQVITQDNTAPGSPVMMSEMVSEPIRTRYSGHVTGYQPIRDHDDTAADQGAGSPVMLSEMVSEVVNQEGVDQKLQRETVSDDDQEVGVDQMNPSWANNPAELDHLPSWANDLKDLLDQGFVEIETASEALSTVSRGLSSDLDRVLSTSDRKEDNRRESCEKEVDESQILSSDEETLSTTPGSSQLTYYSSSNGSAPSPRVIHILHEEKVSEVVLTSPQSDDPNNNTSSHPANSSPASSSNPANSHSSPASTDDKFLDKTWSYGDPITLNRFQSEADLEDFRRLGLDSNPQFISSEELRKIRASFGSQLPGMFLYTGPSGSNITVLRASSTRSLHRLSRSRFSLSSQVTEPAEQEFLLELQCESGTEESGDNNIDEGVKPVKPPRSRASSENSRKNVRPRNSRPKSIGGIENLLAEVTKKFSLPETTQFTMATSGNRDSALKPFKRSQSEDVSAVSNPVSESAAQLEYDLFSPGMSEFEKAKTSDTLPNSFFADPTSKMISGDFPSEDESGEDAVRDLRTTTTSRHSSSRTRDSNNLHSSSSRTRDSNNLHSFVGGCLEDQKSNSRTSVRFDLSNVVTTTTEDSNNNNVDITGDNLTDESGEEYLFGYAEGDDSKALFGYAEEGDDISKGYSETCTSTTAPTESVLLDLVNDVIKDQRLIVTDFTESWVDGRALVALVDKKIPGFYQFHKHRSSFQSVAESLEVARIHLGVPTEGISPYNVIIPDDVKTKDFLVFIADLLDTEGHQDITNIGKFESTEVQLANEVTNSIKTPDSQANLLDQLNDILSGYNIEVDDFAKSWSSGEALLALTDTFVPGVYTDGMKLSPGDRVFFGLKTAFHYLNVLPLVSAEEILFSHFPDQTATYLLQFIPIYEELVKHMVQTRPPLPAAGKVIKIVPPPRYSKSSTTTNNSAESRIYDTVASSSAENPRASNHGDTVASSTADNPGNHGDTVASSTADNPHVGNHGDTENPRPKLPVPVIKLNDETIRTSLTVSEMTDNNMGVSIDTKTPSSPPSTEAAQEDTKTSGIGTGSPTTTAGPVKRVNSISVGADNTEMKSLMTQLMKVCEQLAINSNYATTSTTTGSPIVFNIPPRPSPSTTSSGDTSPAPLPQNNNRDRNESEAFYSIADKTIFINCDIPHSTINKILRALYSRFDDPSKLDIYSPMCFQADRYGCCSEPFVQNGAAVLRIKVSKDTECTHPKMKTVLTVGRDKMIHDRFRNSFHLRTGSVTSEDHVYDVTSSPIVTTPPQIIRHHTKNWWGSVLKRLRRPFRGTKKRNKRLVGRHTATQTSPRGSPTWRSRRLSGQCFNFQTPGNSKVQRVASFKLADTPTDHTSSEQKTESRSDKRRPASLYIQKDKTLDHEQPVRMRSRSENQSRRSKTPEKRFSRRSKTSEARKRSKTPETSRNSKHLLSPRGRVDSKHSQTIWDPSLLKSSSSIIYQNCTFNTYCCKGDHHGNTCVGNHGNKTQDHDVIVVPGGGDSTTIPSQMTSDDPDTPYLPPRPKKWNAMILELRNHLREAQKLQFVSSLNSETINPGLTSIPRDISYHGNNSHGNHGNIPCSETDRYLSSLPSAAHVTFGSPFEIRLSSMSTPTNLVTDGGSDEIIVTSSSPLMTSPLNVTSPLRSVCLTDIEREVDFAVSQVESYNRSLTLRDTETQTIVNELDQVSNNQTYKHLVEINIKADTTPDNESSSASGGRHDNESSTASDGRHDNNSTTAPSSDSSPSSTTPPAGTKESSSSSRESEFIYTLSQTDNVNCNTKEEHTTASKTDHKTAGFFSKTQDHKVARKVIRRKKVKPVITTPSESDPSGYHGNQGRIDSNVLATILGEQKRIERRVKRCSDICRKCNRKKKAVVKRD
eukprot:sb/3460445/